MSRLKRWRRVTRKGSGAESLARGSKILGQKRACLHQRPRTDKQGLTAAEVLSCQQLTPAATPDTLLVSLFWRFVTVPTPLSPLAPPVLPSGRVYLGSDRSDGHVWSTQQIPGALLRGPAHSTASLEIGIMECIRSHRGDLRRARLVYTHT